MIQVRTGPILIVFTTPAVFAIVGLLRRRLVREAVVVMALAAAVLTLAALAAAGVDLPNVSAAIDVFLRRLLPKALLKSIGFTMP